MTTQQNKLTSITRSLIGDFLHETAKEKNVVIEHMAKDLGISKNSIYKVFKGDNSEINTVLLIMHYLQIHIDLRQMDASDFGETPN